MFINQSIMSQTTPAYTFGDCVGSLATISNANIQSPSYWMLDSVLCKDHKRTGLSGEILFFDSVPAYTNFTDNQPLELDIRDLDKLIGIQSISSANWLNVSTQALQTIDAQDMPLEGKPGISLALRLNSSSITFASQSAISLGLSIHR